MCLCTCVCDGRKRIQGVFLAFDGQLNARLVKTAEQNVPRAKGRGRSDTQLHTDTCGSNNKSEVWSCSLLY